MKKRKYDPKTPEEILQHVCAYLYEMYKSPHGGWYNSNAQEAQRIVRSLLRDLGDGNK
jgi:hypothetical protein